jgi:serine/threonine protein kinase
VHRDLKPSNIFVMDDDSVKIIAFGVVHLTDGRSVAGLKGTLIYMSGTDRAETGDDCFGRLFSRRGLL